MLVNKKNVSDPIWSSEVNCRVVAEAGQCMRGSIGRAIEMADIARSSGCWGFKVQLLKPETIASLDAPLYWDNDLGNKNQREAFAKAGIINYNDWKAVKDHCDKIGINFIATPFDLEAVEALEKIGCKYYKIASGDINYKDLIQAVANTHQLLILSTGASEEDEIARALSWIDDDMRVILLACSLAYPTKLDHAEIGRIQTLQQDFVPYIGYSDHTSDSRTALACAALGSVMNEVHFDPFEDDGAVADTDMALNEQGLIDYVQASTIGSIMRGTGLLSPTLFEKPASIGARRSLYASRKILSGTVFEKEDFVALRPGGNVEPWQSEVLIGCLVKQNYSEGDLIPTTELPK